MARTGWWNGHAGRPVPVGREGDPAVAERQVGGAGGLEEVEAAGLVDRGDVGARGAQRPGPEPDPQLVVGHLHPGRRRHDAEDERGQSGRRDRTRRGTAACRQVIRDHQQVRASRGRRVPDDAEARPRRPAAGCAAGCRAGWACAPADALARIGDEVVGTQPRPDQPVPSRRPGCVALALVRAAHDVARQPARRDDRARGRPRRGGAAQRPPAGGDPAALRHLGADALAGAEPRGRAWSPPRSRATSGPALLGLGAAYLLRERHALAVLWLAVLLLAPAAAPDPQLLRAVRRAGRRRRGARGVLVGRASGCSPRSRTPAPGSCCWPRRGRSWSCSGSAGGGGRATSDADLLARLTRLPGLVWVGVFLAATRGDARRRRPTGSSAERSSGSEIDDGGGR